MKTSITNALRLFAGVAMLTGAFAVQAATISISIGTPEVGTLGEFEEGQVQGFLSGGSLSDTHADLFKFIPADVETVRNYLNTNMNPVPMAVGGVRYDLLKEENAEHYTFEINSLYFVLKLGEDHAFFKNNTGGTIRLTYDQTGTAAGLSNITQFNPVPIPAAAYLFGSALIGLAGIGYRRRS